MSEQASGRRKGYRKIKATEVSGRRVVDDGRVGPVTDEEALNWLRDSEAVELASKYAESTADALKKAQLPQTLEEALQTRRSTKLPDWDMPAKMFGFRLPPRLHALVSARAQMEGLSTNALVEAILFQAVNEPVRDPKSAQAAWSKMMRETVLAERERRRDQS